MSFSLRKHVVFAMLVVLAIWPAMHQILVATWNVNPWELCGFAMYVQPDLPVEVRIRAPSGERIVPKPFGADAERAFDQYRVRASAMGLLAPTEGLTEALRRAGLSHSFVEFEVTRPILLSNGKFSTRSATRRVNLH